MSPGPNIFPAWSVTLSKGCVLKRKKEKKKKEKRKRKIQIRVTLM